MNKLQLAKRSFIHAVGVCAYISLVAFAVTSRAGQNFPDNILAPLLMLTVLVFSVGVMGMLIFAKPLMMYLDGQKKEALWLVIYTLLWLAVFITIILLIVGLKM